MLHYLRNSFLSSIRFEDNVLVLPLFALPQLFTSAFFSVSVANFLSNFFIAFQSDGKNLLMRMSVCPCNLRLRTKSRALGAMQTLTHTHMQACKPISMAVIWRGVHHWQAIAWRRCFPRLAQTGKHFFLSFPHHPPSSFQMQMLRNLAKRKGEISSARSTASAWLSFFFAFLYCKLMTGNLTVSLVPCHRS